MPGVTLRAPLWTGVGFDVEDIWFGDDSWVTFEAVGHSRESSRIYSAVRA